MARDCQFGQELGDGGRFDLAAARLNLGLSRRELAEAVGVPYRTILRLEAGLGARPAALKRVADFFGVTVTELIGWPEERRAA